MLPQLGSIFKKFSRPTQSAVTSKDVLFLDLTPRSVKALYAQKGEKNFMLKGLGLAEVKPNQPDDIFSSAIDEAFAQAGDSTNNTVVGIGGPSVFGFLMIAKITRPDPQKRINAKELESLYAKLRSASYAQAKNIRNILFADEKDVQLLDLVVTAYQVDGNQVADPVDSIGTELQITVYSSYSEIYFYSSLMNTLDEKNLVPLAITTSIYSQTKILAAESKNFLLFDMGKSYTDIAVIFGKNIVLTRSFEIGGDFFTEYIMEKTGMAFKEANGKKEAYSEGTLTPEETDTIGDLLYEAGKIWRTGLMSVLESLTGIKTFPKKIYITGGSSNLNVIEELLYEDDWHKALPFSGGVEVMHPADTSLTEFLVDDLKLLKGKRMFAPSSLSVIFSELENPDE